jgi:hypothetical protein
MAHPITPRILRKSLIGLGVLAAVVGGGAGASILDVCGPFTDVPSAICPFVTELYVLGITAGTSSTTFSPGDSLTRGQAAVFAAKAFDQTAARSNRRAALGQWWTSAPHYDFGLGLSYVPYNPTGGIACDGTDIWAASGNEFDQGAITRIRASDGRVLESWDLLDASKVLIAMGRVFVSTYGGTGEQGLFMIDPTQPPAPLTSILGHLDSGFSGLAFDGSRLWASNPGSISIITPSPTTPWTMTTLPGVPGATDVLFDGSSIWADVYANPASLERLDANGNILQTVPVGGDPRFMTFDGANIWVPNFSSASVTVVQASTGAVLATLPIGTGLDSGLPWAASFDGQRVLVTDLKSKVWLFKAADLSPIGHVDLVTGSEVPYQACSDGTQFFLCLVGVNAVGRF